MASPLAKTKKAEAVTGASSQSLQSNGKLSASKAFTKKRTADEVTQLVEVVHNQEPEMMWTEKYQPTCMKDLCIKADKVEAFKQLVKSSRILVLTGPSGCGKNSLIRTFSQDEKIALKYHVDSNPSFVEDLYTSRDQSSTFVPDDLQGLMDFIKDIQLGANKTVVELKKTHFSTVKQVQIPQKQVKNGN